MPIFYRVNMRNFVIKQFRIKMRGKTMAYWILKNLFWRGPTQNNNLRYATERV